MSPFIDASNEDLGGEQLAHGGLYSIGLLAFLGGLLYMGVKKVPFAVKGVGIHVFRL